MDERDNFVGFGHRIENRIKTTQEVGMSEERKKWIDQASYTELLTRWRFAPVGDPFFQGELGDYYAKIMAEKREVIGNSRAVQTSKNIGWKK